MRVEEHRRRHETVPRGARLGGVDERPVSEMDAVVVAGRDKPRDARGGVGTKALRLSPTLAAGRARVAALRRPPRGGRRVAAAQAASFRSNAYGPSEPDARLSTVHPRAA